MDDNLEKKLKLSVLFDLYKELLTNKQKEYFDLYINEDLSLNEISDDFDVSRAAIHDSIQKTEKILLNYEEKIGLLKRNKQISIIINKFENNEYIDNEEFIKEIKEVI